MFNPEAYDEPFLSTRKQRCIVEIASKLWIRLQLIDNKIGNFVMLNCKCLKCGGGLYMAEFPRKVRGVCANTDECYRVSLKCKKCNKRITPPSVRFLWRKVYALPAVALYYSASGFCPSSNKNTLLRWRHYWQLALAQDSPLMSLIRGLLNVEFKNTIISLVEVFNQNQDAVCYFSKAIYLLGCRASLMGHFYRQRMDFDMPD